MLQDIFKIILLLLMDMNGPPWQLSWFPSSSCSNYATATFIFNWGGGAHPVLEFVFSLSVWFMRSLSVSFGRVSLDYHCSFFSQLFLRVSLLDRLFRSFPRNFKYFPTRCSSHFLPSAFLYAVLGFAQMATWAIKKHKIYRREWDGKEGREKYPPHRGAIIPFLL